LAALAQRCLELKQQLQLLDSEFTHVETRLKTAMQTQNVAETDDLKLSQSSRKTMKVEFSQLAEVTLEHKLDLDLQIALTQKLQKQIGSLIEQLNIKEERSTSWRLSVKKLGETDTQNELEF
jgi:ribonuclease D